MPAKKKQSKNVTVRFGDLEMVVLETLVEQCGGSMAGHIRQAVLYFGQFCTSVDWAELEDRLLEKLPKKEHKSERAFDLLHQADVFRQKNFAEAMPTPGESAQVLPDTLEDFDAGEDFKRWS